MSRIGWSLALEVRSFAAALLLVLSLVVAYRDRMVVLASESAVSVVRLEEP